MTTFFASPTQALDKFEIIKKTKIMMDTHATYNSRIISTSDILKCPKLIVTRNDLIAAGVPSNFFIDYVPQSLSVGFTLF